MGFLFSDVAGYLICFSAKEMNDGFQIVFILSLRLYVSLSCPCASSSGHARLAPVMDRSAGPMAQNSAHHAETSKVDGHDTGHAQRWHAGNRSYLAVCRQQTADHRQKDGSPVIPTYLLDREELVRY